MAAPVTTVDMHAAQAGVQMLLDAFGVDEGDHTARTPQRVASAWQHLLRGYREDPRDHLRVTFSAPDDPGLVIVSGVSVRSLCAHHLLPFCGTATVAYRPAVGQSVVGLSKLSRVVDGYARRLQVQEQLGAQVASALQDVLNPVGAAVIVSAVHECMRLRGVEESGSRTTTVSLAGSLSAEDIATVRAAHWQS